MTVHATPTLACFNCASCSATTLVETLYAHSPCFWFLEQRFQQILDVAPSLPTSVAPSSADYQPNPETVTRPPLSNVNHDRVYLDHDWRYLARVGAAVA